MYVLIFKTHAHTSELINKMVNNEEEIKENNNMQLILICMYLNLNRHTSKLINKIMKKK